MGRVIAGFTMSLDGYIAGPDDDVRTLFKWYGAGDTVIESPLGGMTFRVSPESAPVISEMLSSFGAIVTGRRDFDVSRAWGGQSPLGVPIFVVTHSPPQEWAGTDAPFTFVTEGVEHAITLAKQAAGEKDVALGGTTIVRQALRAGLLDGLHIDLAHMLLGSGVRLFEELGVAPIMLERVRVIDAPWVTHMTFRVVGQDDFVVAK
jgi:dihydrofolate reductase